MIQTMVISGTEPIQIEGLPSECLLYVRASAPGVRLSLVALHDVDRSIHVSTGDEAVLPVRVREAELAYLFLEASVDGRAEVSISAV